MKYDGSRRRAAAVDPAKIGERFWAKVKRCTGAECWTWTAALDRRGYGWCRAFDKTTFAHRVAWKLTHGEWPNGVIRHTCDNPRCVNPAHLRTGTQADNMADMVSRGRVARGESKSRLRNSDVIEIRRLAASGVSQRKIRDMFGLKQAHVSRIVRRERWTHLPEET